MLTYPSSHRQLQSLITTNNICSACRYATRNRRLQSTRTSSRKLETTQGVVEYTDTLQSDENPLNSTQKHTGIRKSPTTSTSPSSRLSLVPEVDLHIRLRRYGKNKIQEVEQGTHKARRAMTARQPLSWSMVLQHSCSRSYSKGVMHRKSLSIHRSFHTNTAIRLEALRPQSSQFAVTQRSMTEQLSPFLPIRERLRIWEAENIEQTIVDVAGSAHASNVVSDSRFPGEPGSADNELTEGHENGEELYGEDGVYNDNDVNIYPGDLVVISLNGDISQSTVAVVMTRFENMLQCYTSRGRWLVPKRFECQFSIARWATPAEIEPVIPYLPTKERYSAWNVTENASVPRDVGQHLVTRMQQFDQESKEVYRKHSTTLDNAHDILAHDTDLRYGSLTSVATHLLQISREDITPASLYVVRRALTNADYRFAFDSQSHRLTGFLQIHPKSFISTINEVAGWIRDWQATYTSVTHSPKGHDELTELKKPNPIPAFLIKVREVVKRSRKIRDSTSYGILAPSKVKYDLTRDQDAIRTVPGASFTSDQQKIIMFLESFAMRRQLDQTGALQGLPILLLKASGMYEDLPQIDHSSVYMFLQEIGVVAPWEHHKLHDPHLMLPGSIHAKPLTDLATTIRQDTQKGLELQDSMADYRHDWGDLPVFCIDGPDALEIDDGISIELGENVSDNWIRIHVANPTAFLDRQQPLSRMARHMGETVYTPEQNYTMLPSATTQAYWSLKPNRPCLTFSARIDETGKILETNVRSGRVHNIISLTYEQADKIINPDSTSRPPMMLQVGGEIPTSTTSHAQTPPKLSEPSLDALRALARVAISRRAFRLAAGGIDLSSAKAECQVWSTWKHSGVASSYGSPGRTRFYEGDPIISLSVKEARPIFMLGNETADSNQLVQEAMLLASEVASSWTSERRIPIIHRGTVKQKDGDARQIWDDSCAPAIQQNNGILPEHLALEYTRSLAGGIVSTTPIKHAIIGLSHYTKVTSPLRRYGDMIAHWQIEAALRDEAQRDSSLTTRRIDSKLLPFSHEMLQSFMLGYQARERLINIIKRKSVTHWMHMLLMRAHLYGEAKLPFETLTATMDVEVERPSAPLHRGYVRELGTRCLMRAPRLSNLEERDVKNADVWQIAIDYVEVYGSALFVKPVKLLRRYN